jgi:hypothetical protein
LAAAAIGFFFMNKKEPSAVVVETEEKTKDGPKELTEE